MSGACRIGVVVAQPLVDPSRSPAVSIPLLDTHGELSEIRTALSLANTAVRLRVAVGCSLPTLRTLLTMGVRILHYSGHGMADSTLAFEHDIGARMGTLQRGDVRSLSRLFRAGGVNTSVVVVSACHSEEAGNKFVEAGVPHVVCVRRDEQVSDKSSRLFAHHFYFPLLMGRTVRDAFAIASETVMADLVASMPPSMEHAQASEAAAREVESSFMLLPLGEPHDEPVFSAACPMPPPGPFIEEKVRNPTVNHCPLPPSKFVGRQHEMVQVLSYLANGDRLVTISGGPQIGKTALATRTCQYLAERQFAREICYLSLTSSRLADDASPSSVQDVCSLIGTALQLQVQQHQQQQPQRDEAAEAAAAVAMEGEPAIPVAASAVASPLGAETHGPTSRNSTPFVAIDEEELIASIEEKFADVEHKVLLLIDGADRFLARPETVTTAEVAVVAAEAKQSADEENNGNAAASNGDNGQDGDAGSNEAAGEGSSASQEQQGHMPVLVAVLDSVLQRIPNLQILLTARTSITETIRNLTTLESETEKYLPVGPLDPLSAARLLVRSAPRPITLAEMNTSQRGAAIASLAQRQVMRILNGNPKAIRSFAQQYLGRYQLNDSPEMHSHARKVLNTAVAHIPPTPTALLRRASSAQPPQPPGGATPGTPHGQFTAMHNGVHMPVAVAVAAEIPEHAATAATTASAGIGEMHAVTASAAGGLTGGGTPHKHRHEHGHGHAHGVEKGKDGGSSAASSARRDHEPWHVSSRAFQLAMRRATQYIPQYPDCAQLWARLTTSPAPGGQPLTAVTWEALSASLEAIFLGTLLLARRRRRGGEHARAARSLFHVEGSRCGDGDHDGDHDGDGDGDGDRAEDDERSASGSSVYDSVYLHLQNRMHGGNSGGGRRLSADAGDSAAVRAVDAATDADLAAVRGLNTADLEFLRRRLVPPQRREPTTSAPAPGAGNITIEQFTEFCGWWCPLLNTIVRMQDEWNCRDPVLIHGFLTRERTERLLNGHPRGTFILRFSERHNGWMAVSFMEYNNARSSVTAPAVAGTAEGSTGAGSEAKPPRLTPQHCLISVENEGYKIFFTTGTRVFNSLQSLLMNCRSLQIFHPNRSKEEALQSAAIVIAHHRHRPARQREDESMDTEPRTGTAEQVPALAAVAATEPALSTVSSASTTGGNEADDEIDPRTSLGPRHASGGGGGGGGGAAGGGAGAPVVANSPSRRGRSGGSGSHRRGHHQHQRAHHRPDRGEPSPSGGSHQPPHMRLSEPNPSPRVSGAPRVARHSESVAAANPHVEAFVAPTRPASVNRGPSVNSVGAGAAPAAVSTRDGASPSGSSTSTASASASPAPESTPAPPVATATAHATGSSSVPAGSEASVRRPRVRPS